MMDPLLEQDLQKLLAALQDGPQTQTEIVPRLRLSAARVGTLLEHLRQRQLVHTPRCVSNDRGRTVNLWELRSPADPETLAL